MPRTPFSSHEIISLPPFESESYDVNTTHRLPYSLRPFNHHALSIWNADQDPATWYSDVLDLHAAKDIQFLQVRTRAEDATDNKVSDLLAEADLQISQLGIDLVLSKSIYKRLP